MTLYVSCCARKDSRTDILAKAVLERLSDNYTELNLYDILPPPLTEDMILLRDKAISEGDYSDPVFDLSKQFASADNIVLACPFWDYSFPSVLKNYIENIFVMGIVTCFNESGIPEGMCRAKGIIYVTTSGGKFIPDFSYEYIRKLADEMFGIRKTLLVKAEMLDISEENPGLIMEKAICSTDTLLKDFTAEGGIRL